MRQSQPGRMWNSLTSCQ